MALEKTTSDDKIEIVGEFKILQIRATIKVIEDGELLNESYHRRIIVPGQDASGDTDEIKALVALYHTPENIAAYEQYIANQLPPNA